MKLFSGKSKSHNDEPSKPLEPKVIENQEPNYEGDVRGSKYEPVESINPDTRGYENISKSDAPVGWLWPDIDRYNVDYRIWDRVAEYGGGDGSGGGPHTHTEYSLTTHNHDGDYSQDAHTHSEYSNKTHKHDADYANKTHTHPAPTGLWKSWTGSQAQYDALGNYDPETLYVVV